MADVEKIAAGLRIALESATSGEWWFWNEAEQGASYGEPIAWLHGPRRLVKDHSTGFAIEDAAYIVAAQPENIRALLDELSRLREVALLVAAPIENFPGPDWTKIGLTKIIQKFQNRAARALSEREGQE